MEDIILIINKLGGASFATLLALILWGGFKRVWVWGREVDAIELRNANEKKELKEAVAFWQNIAVRVTGLAETQVQILRVKEKDNAGEDNKRNLMGS